MEIEEKLKKKKWPTKEIEKTAQILYQAKQKQTPTQQLFNILTYWTALILAIIGNFIVSVVMVPLLIALSGPALYFTLFFVGVSFGALIYTVIRMAEAIDPKKNLIAGMMIISLAIINIYMITQLSNRLELIMGIAPLHKPIFVISAYAIGYITPYLFFLIKDHLNKRQNLNTAAY